MSSVLSLEGFAKRGVRANCAEDGCLNDEACEPGPVALRVGLGVLYGLLERQRNLRGAGVDIAR